MDQQPTDPNNPNNSTPPVTPPVMPAPASMWDVQPNSPITPPPVTELQIPTSVPTFTPPLSTEPATPSGSTTPNFGGNTETSAVPSWAPTNENSEAVPTDLSNLMSIPSSAPAETTQPTVTASPVVPEVSQVVTSGSRGFPKIILILGVALILIAIGASAYFILGIGNSSNLPTSVPAEQQTLTAPPTQIVPSVAPIKTGTGSATLGNPSGATLSVTPAPATISGTSAINALRSRITPTP